MPYNAEKMELINKYLMPHFHLLGHWNEYVEEFRPLGLNIYKFISVSTNFIATSIEGPVHA